MFNAGHLQPTWIDDSYPGQVVNFKGGIMHSPKWKRNSAMRCQEVIPGEFNPEPQHTVVYFCGAPKQDEITHYPWVAKNWQ